MARHRDDLPVRRAQAVDLARSVPYGLLIPLETSVLLTIAIKRYDASGLVKGVVAAAAGIGMLASPVVTAATRRVGRPVMVVAAMVTLAGAAGMALAALGPLAIFVFGSVIGIASYSAIQTLMTVSYQQNYPAGELGKRVGRSLVVRVAVSATAGLVFGGLLRSSIGNWRWVVLAGVGALAAMALGHMMMPSEPLPPTDVRNRIWPHFHLLGEDRQLRLTLTAWMMMGFGNLALLPLRVEYLTNDRYGIHADAGRITMLTVTLPAVVRLVMLPWFGRVFDRMSFFSARIVLNLLFALYIAVFFTGTSSAALVAGSITFGIAAAGGDLMWSLWVTKFAPPGRVADYMGLHTFFTGIRAVCAPIVAFLVVERMSLTSAALGAAVLIVGSALLLVPEARAERITGRPSAAFGPDAASVLVSGPATDR